MKPHRISLMFGVILLALGLIWSVLWFEGSDACSNLMLLGTNLSPGLVQVGFYRHYCSHPRKPGDWELWVPTMTVLTAFVLFINRGYGH